MDNKPPTEETPKTENKVSKYSDLANRLIQKRKTAALLSNPITLIGIGLGIGIVIIAFLAIVIISSTEESPLDSFDIWYQCQAEGQLLNSGCTNALLGKAQNHLAPEEDETGGINNPTPTSSN